MDQVGAATPDLSFVGQFTFVLMVAVPLAFIATLLLLALYLRAVKRSMLQRVEPSTPKAAATQMAGAAPGPAPKAGPEFLVLETPVQSSALQRAAITGPWQTAAIYGVAAFAYATMLAAAQFKSGGFGFDLMPFAFVVTCLAWPIVITTGLVAATHWRAWLAILAVYLCALAAMAAVVITRSDAFTWQSAVTMWRIQNLEPTLLVLPFLARRIRALGPMVLAFMIVCVGGAIAAITWMGASEERIISVLELGRPAGFDYLITLSLLVLAAAVVLGFVGFVLLRGMGRLYSARWISDESMIIDSIWLLFAVTSAMRLVFTEPHWAVAPFAAFALYKVIALLGFALRRRVSGRAAGGDPQVLLLRVFSLGPRSERLFDAFSKYWRHAGGIRLIAGPDLAMTTVEPHEFLDFLTGKLARRFISGPETLTQRLNETEPNRDFDGRYRVGDFFCHDDTWRMALTHLVQDSNAVLMDVRGFTAKHSGCIFEIHELLNVVPLDRAVFVIDDTTDDASLRKTFAEGWKDMRVDSPNRRTQQNAVRLFRLSGVGVDDISRLVRVVADAADNK